MSAALKLLELCTAQGISLRPGEAGKLKVVPPPEKLPPALCEQLKRHKPEILRILAKAKQSEEKHRPFLPRPLGQEDAIDPWEAWTPFFDWLSAHHPEHFRMVLAAEEALSWLEQQGITSGDVYDHACRDLLLKFETARKLKMKAEVKVWLQ